MNETLARVLWRLTPQEMDRRFVETVRDPSFRERRRLRHAKRHGEQPIGAPPETLAAQVQAARDRLISPPLRDGLGMMIRTRKQLEADADRYAYLVGLQQQRESVVRIGCDWPLNNCQPGDVRPCHRCTELRRIDAEIAEAG